MLPVRYLVVAVSRMLLPIRYLRFFIWASRVRGKCDFRFLRSLDLLEGRKGVRLVFLDRRFRSLRRFLGLLVRSSLTRSLRVLLLQCHGYRNSSSCSSGIFPLGVP